MSRILSACLCPDSFVLKSFQVSSPLFEKAIYFRNIPLMSPMALRSLNLPGVGTKYEFETDKGDTVAIFFTKTGTIQMYTLPERVPYAKRG